MVPSVLLTYFHQSTHGRIDYKPVGENTSRVLEASPEPCLERDGTEFKQSLQSRMP
jgi:hypothetical protein